ncbi:hypothetical protein [Paenibacillus tundrae]|uniref:ApeA N-terminal domain-containing protein n=1 Tax=Paenibacillus tundrae TaxID=528187 RepID=A0ABT9WHT9_9BACL|nr:hypothetical protein [Paenibacillus tundrae]MDQ0172826.1 hypothetical protein [Paenibacillus tundrae]
MASYTYSFQMKFNGASVNGSINKNLYPSLGDSLNTLDALHFTSTGEDSTIVNGQVTTDFAFPAENFNVYHAGKSFVLFSLEPWITSTLLLHTQSERIGALNYVYRNDPVKFKLKYHSDEGFDSFFSADSPLEARYMSYDKADPIKLQEIEETLPSIANFNNISNASIKDALHSAMFWIHRANEAGGTQGIDFSGLHARFRDLWSAFNALFSLESVQGERDKIVNYMNNRPYAREFITKYTEQNIQVIRSFADASLTLRKGSRYPSISDEVKHFLDVKQSVDSACDPELAADLEGALLLSIYSVRNKSFHGGELEAATQRVRECIDVLDRFLKVCIIGEIRSAT